MMGTLLNDLILANSGRSSGRFIAVMIGICLAVGFIIDIALNRHADVALATVLSGYGVAMFGASKGLDYLKDKNATTP